MEKDRVTMKVINILEKKFGDIKNKLEVYDVATPSTFIRYTNNWKASYEGFIPTVVSQGTEVK